MDNFFKGLLIGISMAAPIGPISILCIRKSLVRGHYLGIASALGIALADGIYATIAAFGLTAISTFLITNKDYLYVIGGIMLVFLGIQALKAPQVSLSRTTQNEGFFTTLLQTSFVTLTNPMTIVLFIGVFAAFGFDNSHLEIQESISLCLGVMAGSALWFISLSILVSQLRTKITPRMFALVNKLSGSLLILFGCSFVLKAAISLASHYFS